MQFQMSTISHIQFITVKQNMSGSDTTIEIRSKNLKSF